ncbi:DUF4190 domain-containing protein [Streptomyces sp. NRRL B-24484]|uniref:DUF4190 domain-containing protein n=1 Tax=Streptomyces sp. NRRL B-24484 TaxID=1463833 RepID=UPI0004BFF8B6|nr:DUF4190 domain-containing protein [Streptomyces sp. NRRL B-24484]
MPSDQDVPPPGGSAAGNDAFARAFAPPSGDTPPPAGNPWGAPGPYPQPAPYPQPGAVPPGGFASYGAQGWGTTPPYAAYGPLGWQPPPGPPTRWNGFAVTSFVLGILGGACLLWIGAVAFGIAALREVRRRNERGRGLAIAGIALGGVWAVVVAVVTVIALMASDADLPESDTGSVTGSGSAPASPHSDTWNVFELVAGQCFVKPAGAGTDSVTDVRPVDCAAPHYGEVFATAPSDEKSYPGKAAVIADATKGCNDALLGFAPDNWKLPVAVRVHFFYPDEHAWSQQGTGRRSTCFLTDSTDRLTGSLQQDLARFDADQMAYLGAEHRVDQAFALAPQTEPADDPAAFRAWAGTLAGGVRQEIGELTAHTWGGAASRPVQQLVDELRKAQPHLTAAGDAKDAKTLQNELAAATGYLGYDRPKAVRAALRLGTDDSRLTHSDGSDDDTRTDGPAPVLAPDSNLSSTVRI